MSKPKDVMLPGKIANHTCKLQSKEIQRLNDIINTLEKCLEERWLKWKDSDCLEFIGMTNEDKFLLDFLRKLTKKQD